MHAAEPLLERGRTHARRRQHARACLDIAAVIAGAWQVGLDQAHALERNAIGKRMIARRAVGLEAMYERIQARGRGDRGRQADGQLRIADDDAGHHLRMEDDLLLVRGLVDDHAGAADFRAGTGGGRHGNHRRDAAALGTGPPVTHVLEIPQRPGLTGHEGDHLAGVERRATAECDHSIVAASAKNREPGVDIGGDRIAAYIREQAGGRHQRQGPPDHRRVAQALVGDQKRALHAERGTRRRQFGDATRTGPDEGRIVPVRLQDRFHLGAHVVTRR